MIKIEQVNYFIGEKQILSDVSLNLDKGGVIALIGPNGAGKSTLLNLMARINPLKVGRISFDGLDIQETPSRILAQKVSILQQHIQFLSRLTVKELLIFARYPYHKGRPKDHDFEVIQKTLEYFNLLGLQHQFIDELSGGQRQRTLVAMVFAQDTDYILLDEPLNNLDINHAKNLMMNLKKAVTDFGKTIVIVLHDINYASHYADYVVAMKSGQIIYSGKTQEVLVAKNISDLYEMPVHMICHCDKNVCLYF